MEPQRMVTVEIPGFTVTDHGGAFTAERTAGLSPYQQQYGCRMDVTANTLAELQLLCTAERVKAELVAQAEFTTTAVRPTAAGSPPAPGR